ncbi:MAG: methyl-accepting chemotaxis protein [Porcipelethomonas sp.]
MVCIYILAFAVFLVIDTLIIAAVINRKLKPLEELTGAASSMLSGELNYKSSYRKNDEIGSVCLAVEQANEKIYSYIRDIDSKLTSMACGNFNNSIDQEYIGDFSNIKDSLIKIQDSLRSTLTQISSVTGQVSNDSDMVSSGSQELSMGAVRQTESIEKLSDSFSVFSEKAYDTAKNAVSANTVVTSMGERVNACSNSMDELKSAMNNINNTSEQIRTIIKKVEEIAFQTNILALNAAVEAARAGDAGKGFAVVANEVRNLASKSADAASITTKLIGEACEAVNDGTKLTEITASELSEIVNETKQAVSFVEIISRNAESEQKELSSISSQLEQISAVIQTNTATAKESAASSKQLSGQAGILQDMINKFRL